MKNINAINTRITDISIIIKYPPTLVIDSSVLWFQYNELLTMVVKEYLKHHFFILKQKINPFIVHVVTSESVVSGRAAKQLHFGMTGKANVITGKETFFKYYFDKLMDKN